MPRPRVLLIGSNGQLGQYLCDVFEAYELICLTRKKLDLCKLNDIDQSIRRISPDILINTSAYTAVDKAEEESELAFLINASAPAAMAETCFDLEIPFVHFSTDYVFSGNKSTPYHEDDPTKPQGVYGASKLKGELAILASQCQAYIFRTAWVYSQRGQNFYKSMLQLADNRTELNIVSDQFGSPTYASSIAISLVEVVRKILDRQVSEAGIYHMTCGGITNWSGFAKQIFALENLDIMVNEIDTNDYPTLAKRPAYSVLDNSKLFNDFGVKLPEWQNALDDCVFENNKEHV